ncbi:MAG: hypothetical protein DRR11_03745 [Gammaproteobacteria bacterium]|nr:MAG: hypothetical protein DRR11_03745 [Gammaproteobacteria bacterium]
MLGIVIACAIVIGAIPACATTEEGKTTQVVVAPLGDGDTSSESGMTREELEAHVRRFADRYMTRIAVAVNTVMLELTTAKQMYFMQDWKTVSYAAIVDVAIGPDAVTNLLDMMVLTKLSRIVVEDFWVPEHMTQAVGEEASAQFLQTFYDLEDDIWTIADDVLTQTQQDELEALVIEWRAENPDQHYPWYVRLSNFSGQRAASLNAVKQSGGLLKEVARAREAAEEMQAFGERILFYLQRAPMLTSGQFEGTVNNVLSGPEVSNLLANTDRFVESVERLVAVIEALPGGRLTAVDQFMDRVADERIALLQGMVDAGPGVSELLAELLPVLESIERTVEATNVKDPDGQPFDVNEYRALVQDSAATAAEMRQLMDSIAVIMAGGDELEPLVSGLVQIETAILNRFFMQMVILILILFAALIGYRFISVRYISR